MPLRMARRKRVTVKLPLPPPVYGDGSAPAFGAGGETVWATVQPLGGTTEATLYGEESVHMRLLLTIGPAILREGMGVCVDRTDGQCDYRVAAPPERWGSHTRAVLKRL